MRKKFLEPLMNVVEIVSQAQWNDDGVPSEQLGYS